MADTSIWPIVIGGALAIAGGAVTSGLALLSKHIESSSERKKRRADKFEQLVTAIYEFDHWLTSMRNIEAYGNAGEVGMSPMAKIEALAAVHFPTFNRPIGNLSDGATVYTAWMVGAKRKRLLNQLDTMNEGLDEAYSLYLGAMNKLLSALRAFAEQEFR